MPSDPPSGDYTLNADERALARHKAGLGAYDPATPSHLREDAEGEEMHEPNSRD